MRRMPDHPPAEHPLQASAERLGCFDVGAPTGPGWHLLGEATDPALAERLVERVAAGDGHGPRPRAVAGAYVGGSLTWAVLQPVAALFAAERRALDLAPGNVAVQLDDDGWATRAAVLVPRFAALPDDPAADHDDVVTVPDDAALAAWAADRIVATFEPVLAAVRAASPYGTSGHWGTLADTISAILWLLHEQGASGTDLDAAWHRTEALVDAVQARVPALRARSRRFTLDAPGAPVALPMRSTCCLYYRTPEAAAAEGDGLCTTCPRRTDEERVRLVEANLRAEADAADAADAAEPADAT